MFEWPNRNRDIVMADGSNKKNMRAHMAIYPILPSVAIALPSKKNSLTTSKIIFEEFCSIYTHKCIQNHAP